MSKVLTLLGDEAVALGAIHAGISAAYGYPGTPSTEIMEFLQDTEACAVREASVETEASGGESLAGTSAGKAAFIARWCVNEKTALEAALGTSFAGRRALVTMKHVGLNVAADPFVNGALLGIKGGLVIAVADDPGMHSSQGEQDSRFYAFFALVPCLEPRSQQEAYDLCREAFDLSERFHVPVMLRLATRLSHARSEIHAAPERPPNPCSKTEDKTRWMLLPAHARRNYAALIARQEEITRWSAAHPINKLELADRSFAVITAGLGGNYYEENLADLVAARGKTPSRLHIGAYPLPEDSIRTLCEGAEEVLIIEEGQPFIEERLRGILPAALKITGRLAAGGPADVPPAATSAAAAGSPAAAAGGNSTAEAAPPAATSAAAADSLAASAAVIPRTGELDPDNVRAALGLPPRASALETLPAGNPAVSFAEGKIGRPPQLCQGCPHADSYETLNHVVAALSAGSNTDTNSNASADSAGAGSASSNAAGAASAGASSNAAGAASAGASSNVASATSAGAGSAGGHPNVCVNSDIGCYSLGAAPPYSAIESIVCMGASVGMARGAADAGIQYAFAVIGDSTFIHSGITTLIDAVEENTPMTLIILDNSTVAMTGCQKTAFPSARLKNLILGTGLDPAHYLELEAKKTLIGENAAKLQKEAEYRGLSVVVFKRECLEAFRKRLKAEKA